MLKCDQCGLPITICNALAFYSKAVVYWNRGKLEQSKEMAEAAQEEYDRYLKEWKANA